MKFAIILIAVLISWPEAAESFPPHRCGIKGVDHDKVPLMWRIMGGVNASLGEFPWYASMRDIKFPDFNRCGGSIVDEQWVLTAAHCVQRVTNASTIMFRLGDLNLLQKDPGEVDVNVTKVIKTGELSPFSSKNVSPLSKTYFV